MKDKVVATVLLIIMGLNTMDVFTDIQLGVPTWHIVSEGLIVLISGAMALYLIYEMHNRSRRLLRLKQELTLSNQKIGQLTDDMKKARQQYSESVQQQLHQWQLTNSEKEVALLMLKGLNFQEISVVRSTKEKTVRQQASSVYAKSGLDGRHELAAWFLEDFIGNSKAA
ncbi:helix-turn-helix transcriptional regulator [Lacimicrobium alkaliphilum]|uniref:HTH luxR-type domain-containing protein n=1 Tax=Lacimicrobium alkaliphilum TaxID=1526571 RepID=A0ABQ1RA70_9ALTE|nr:LuxR C-terminal-related transcriptional regulator [Lacimicrobium alkaliphilum]GGD63747.1 hypothetical protein GCM10011357_18850 [Lacimicrobium alkaliphilum]